jgi:hypothetical protein
MISKSYLLAALFFLSSLYIVSSEDIIPPSSPEFQRANLTRTFSKYSINTPYRVI